MDGERNEIAMIRLGVVGAGGMGQVHCTALPKLGNCEFTAVADMKLEVAKKAAQKFGIKAYADYNQMWGDVDGIIVATPPDSHKDIVLAAAEAGVHSFCEKPISRTLADADSMIEATEKCDVVFMIGHVLRFYPVHILGKKLVDDGEIGNVVYVETDYTSRYSAPRTKPSSWYGTVGGLLENGIHKADLINWFGGEAATVASEVGSLSGYEDWEDYAVTLVRYKSGIVGILRWGPFMGARGTTDTVLDGSKGSLRLSISKGRVYRKLIDEGDWVDIAPDVPASSGWMDYVVCELTHFVNCILEGKTPITEGRAGRRAVELVIASYRSARERKKITLPI
jgi:UDP-N-acetylglucosamine 3-dehydrogenase